jgi:hypothetical protein
MQPHLTVSWRQRTITLLVIVTCGVSLPFPAAAEEPKNVLFYGNSFTIGIGSTEAEGAGGVPGIVQTLATAAGHAAPRVENAAVAGQTLGWHIANNLAVIANPQDFTPPSGFQWDVVVLQEYSTRPTHIGDLAAFLADVLALFAHVRGHSLAVKPVLYETWARAPGHEFYTGPDPVFPGGPAQMQQELREGYNLAQQDFVATYGSGFAVVAPVGDAFEDTNWADLHSTDDYHANSRGTYLAALVIFGTIYRERTAGLPPVLGSISMEEAAALQAYADAVLPDPCGFSGPDCNGNCIPDAREPDCNANTIPDACDLTAGTSRDCNNNAMPDECEIPSLGVWASCIAGPCGQPPCGPLSEPCCLLDLDGDGDVDLHDVAWLQRTYVPPPPPAPLMILIDLGSSSSPTTGQAQYWNNLHPGNMSAPLQLLDTAGGATGLTLSMSTGQRFNGANANGTTTPPPGSAIATRGYPATATQDSLFGNDVMFDGGVFPTAQMQITGLAAGATYDLTFCASRMGVADVRTTDYSVVGANSGSATLDVANNDSNVVTVTGLIPDTANALTITVDKGATNNNSHGFYYLGVLEIARTVP